MSQSLSITELLRNLLRALLDCIKARREGNIAALGVVGARLWLHVHCALHDVFMDLATVFDSCRLIKS